MAIVVFPPLGENKVAKINSIICCDKHVSFLCVAFVGEEYSRELRIIFVYKSCLS